MDFTIGKNQQDIVGFVCSALCWESIESFDDFPKVSGSRKLYLGQCRLICTQNVANSCDIRCHWVSIQSKAVFSLLWHVSGDASETKSGEFLVCIVGFQNCAHLLNGLIILILRTQSMQRTWHVLIAVGGGVIDRDGKRYLPAQLKILEERFTLFQLKLLEVDSSAPLTPIRSQ